MENNDHEPLGDDSLNDDGLSDLFAQVTPPPSPGVESLEDVLHRFRRGRTRILGVALALALVAGPALGMVVGRATASHPQTVATGGPAVQPGPVVHQELSGGGSAIAMGPGGPPATRLFLRTTADGVAVRAYLLDLPTSPPAASATECASSSSGGPAVTVPCPPPLPAACTPATELQAELSDEGAAAVSAAPVWPNARGSVSALQAGFFGIAEGTPAAWVAVRATAEVASVRVRFSDGATDTMVPVQGYAVLAHRMAAPTVPATTTAPSPAANDTTPVGETPMVNPWAPTGEVEALDASGTVVTKAELATSNPMPAECAPQAPVGPPVTVVPSVPPPVPGPLMTAPAPAAPVPGAPTTVAARAASPAPSPTTTLRR